MRRFIKLIILLIPGLAAADSSTDRRVVDRVAAVIERDIITLRELEIQARPYLEQLKGISDPAVKEKRRSEILRQVLDVRIGERIVDREIERSKEQLVVSDQEIDQVMQEVMRLNNLDDEQLRAALYAQGLSWDGYREMLRKQRQRARLVQMNVGGRVEVKDAEVERRCEERKGAKGAEQQVCAAHILLALPEDATAEDEQALEARARQLRAELLQGADFAAYAMKHSDDKSSADGSLGCFGSGEMVPAFERAAFTTPVGAISALVRTQFGFHIIKVLGREAQSGSSCDGAALNAYRDELYQEKMQTQMQRWIDELKSKAFVEVRI